MCSFAGTTKFLQSIWYKLDEIAIYDGLDYYIQPLKQHTGNTIKFSMHAKSENICCCGIWQWTTLDWCYSIALEAASLVQLSNTSREWLIVKYHNAIYMFSPYYLPVWKRHLPGFSYFKILILKWLCPLCQSGCCELCHSLDSLFLHTLTCLRHAFCTYAVCLICLIGKSAV